MEITEADGSPAGKVLYRELLYTRREPEFEGDFDTYASAEDSIAYAPFEGYREFGKMYAWAFGENNKKLFTTALHLPHPTLRGLRRRSRGDPARRRRADQFPPTGG